MRRAEMQALKRVVGGSHGAVLGILIDAYLGRRPLLSAADRHFFDAIMRRWQEMPPRKPRGPKV